MSQVASESPGAERGQPDDAGLIAESCRAPERFGVVFDRHAAAIHGYIARRLGRDAADIAGRHGLGFLITLPPAKYKVYDELTLDSKTFAVMGQQVIFGPGGPSKVKGVVGGTAVLKTALVSGPGKLP